MNENPWHFWYCRSAEENTLTAFCVALDFGTVTQLGVPMYNTCRIPVLGELAEVPYTFCAEERDAYERFPGCSDKIYLGEGHVATCRFMTVREIRDRMEALGMVIPDRLRVMAG